MANILSPIFFIVVFVQFFSFSSFSFEVDSCQNIFRTIESFKNANIAALNVARVVRSFAIDEFEQVFYFGSADDGLVMGYSPISKHILIFQNYFGTITPHSEFALPQVEKSPTSFFQRLFRSKIETKIQIRSIKYSNIYLKPEVSVVFESQTATAVKTFMATYYLLEKKWGNVSEAELTHENSEQVLLQTFMLNPQQDIQSLMPPTKMQKNISSPTSDLKNVISIYYDRKKKWIVATQNLNSTISSEFIPEGILRPQVIFLAQLAYSGNIEMMYNQQQLVGYDKAKQKIIFFENLF